MSHSEYFADRCVMIVDANVATEAEARPRIES